MKIINLSREDSVLNHYIQEIRDEVIQKEPIRFRKNLERIGEFFAFEISKKLKYISKETKTPLGEAETRILHNKIVLATILRAGLPMHQGMLNIFDHAQNAFVSAYRRHHKDGSFDVKVEYSSSPSLDDKVLIISDPMLATGHSMVLTYNELLRKGKPATTHIVSVVASTQGIEELKKKIRDKNITLWIAALDEELTAQAYIVPGLGDAGDLAYGIKED
ncbi:MAG: uracil phosphoribosyltransferase [Bacteroidales bacterium]|nr:uracil phosphoribosyltransferase [Bacteroidales bacterium]